MRYTYLDYAKGFAIILMLLTHAMTGENAISTWAFSFHMPIFFVICGILLEGKYAGSVTARQAAVLAKRRTVQIGIPYLIFGTALACFYSLLNVIGGQPVTFAARMKGLLTLQGIDSLWFLPCYVLAELFAAVLRFRDAKTVRNALLIAVIATICVLAGRMPSAGWLRMLLKSAIGWVFVETGALLARHAVLKKTP